MLDFAGVFKWYISIVQELGLVWPMPASVVTNVLSPVSSEIHVRIGGGRRASGP